MAERGVARRARIVANARACIGARFRAFGRDPAFGMDCVGVAAFAFGRAAPPAYILRGGDWPGACALAEAAGLAAVATARAGDLLILDCGSGQLHLAVKTEGGFVHADLGIGRVVEAPGWPAGRIVAAYGEDD